MAVEELRDGKLRTDAVRAGDENRVLHILAGCEREAGAEAAEASNHLRTVRLCNGSLDRIDRACALVDIDAGIRIAHMLCFHGHCSSSWISWITSSICMRAPTGGFVRLWGR